MGINTYGTSLGINFNSRLGMKCFSEPAPFTPYFRLLHGAAIYAILVPDNNWTPRHFRVIYFEETENASQRVAASHERYADWRREAGSSELYVAQSWMQGSTKLDRWSVERALIDCYQPACNLRLYGSSDRVAAMVPESNFAKLLPSLLHNPARPSDAVAPPSGSSWLRLMASMGRTYPLFISHAWEYNEEYYQLETPSAVTPKPASCGHLKTGQLDQKPGQDILPQLLVVSSNIFERA